MTALLPLLVMISLGVVPPTWTTTKADIDGLAAVFGEEVDTVGKQWAARGKGPVTMRDLGRLYRSAMGPETIEILDQEGRISRRDSVKLAQLRDQLHDETLTALAKKHGDFAVLDAGRGGTARSDLDFTLVGKHAGHTDALVNDYHREFQKVAKARTGSALGPSRMGIAPFDGELFFPDPLHSGMTAKEYGKSYGDMLAKMAKNPEALASEGTFVTQVLERAKAGDEAFKAGLRDRPVLRTITSDGPSTVKPSMRMHFYRLRVAPRKRLAFAFDAAVTYFVAIRAHDANPEKIHKYFLRMVAEGAYVQYAHSKGIKAQPWTELTGDDKRTFIKDYYFDGTPPSRPADVRHAAALFDALEYADAVEKRASARPGEAKQIAIRIGLQGEPMPDGANTDDLARKGRALMHKAVLRAQTDTVFKTVTTRAAELGGDSANLREGSKLALTHLFKALRAQDGGADLLERIRGRRWSSDVRAEIHGLIDSVEVAAKVEEGGARKKTRVQLLEMRNTLQRGIAAVAPASRAFAEAWRQVRRGEVSRVDVKAWTVKASERAMTRLGVSKRSFDEAVRGRKGLGMAIGIGTLSATLAAVEACQLSGCDPRAVGMALLVEAISAFPVGAAVLAVGAGVTGDPAPALLMAPLVIGGLSEARSIRFLTSLYGSTVLVVGLGSMTVRIVGHALLKPIHDKTIGMYLTGVKPAEKGGWITTGRREAGETAFDSILSPIAPDSHSRWHDNQMARKRVKDLADSEDLISDERRLYVYDHLRPKVAAAMSKGRDKAPKDFVDYEPWLELAVEPSWKTVEKTPSWTPYHKAWGEAVTGVVRRWVADYLMGTGDFRDAFTPDFREHLSRDSNGKLQIIPKSRTDKVFNGLVAILLGDYRLVERHVMVKMALEAKARAHASALNEVEETTAAFSTAVDKSGAELRARFGEYPHLPDAETEPQEGTVVRAHAWLSGSEVRVSADVFADDRVHPPPYSVVLQGTAAPRAKKGGGTPKGKYEFLLKVNDARGHELYSKPFTIIREVEEVPFGVHETHHRGGQLHERWFTIPAGSKYGGMKEGAYVALYPSGETKTMGEFFLDKRKGRWTTYFEPSGRIGPYSVKRHEDYGAVDGVIERHSEWYDHGDLRETLTYRQGTPWKFQAYPQKGKSDACSFGPGTRIGLNDVKGEFDRHGLKAYTWHQCVHGAARSRTRYLVGSYMDGKKHGVWRGFTDASTSKLVERWEYAWDKRIEHVFHPSVVQDARNRDKVRRIRYSGGRVVSKEWLDRMPY